tara:strand:- start:622 stop:1008 length:387 start_codon:yes stop_codon:yes gene_type:complete
MSRYFAEINSLTNEVIRVIVCNDKNWCETNLGGIWIETYKYSSDKKCAGKGMIYYQDKDNFASKQPYPSWTLDENCDWQPPIVIPNLTEEDKDNNKYYYWDEALGNWSLQENWVPIDISNLTEEPIDN